MRNEQRVVNLQGTIGTAPRPLESVRRCAMTKKPGLSRTVAWIDDLRNKCCTADEAVKVIRGGDRVYIHPGAAEPEQLVRAMVRRAPDLRNVTVIHLLTAGSADYVRPEMAGQFL